ncbi:C2 family cysteine protease [Streptomyces sp. NPDC005355]|uniref:C2 family cysteine protease n=1 Tax=Streptomyces sp. NPDC005355 TaxID=3157038 RepID=UPI0033B23BE3
MSFRGFNSVKLTAFANDLDGLARHSNKLHTDVASLLTTVQQQLPPGETASRDPGLQDLVGDLIPAAFFGRSRLPGSLCQELGDMQASIKRRIKQLDGMHKFQDAGYPVDSSMLFLDEKAPDGKKVDEALNRLKGLNGKDFGVNGNRDDLTKVSKSLDGLTAAELDTVITKADPQDLARFNKLANNTDDSGWSPFDANGLPEAERRDSFSLMLSKIGPENMDKFMKAFPGVQPTFTNTDAYEEHGNSQNGQTNSGIHWQKPSDPLFNGDVSADEINQRQFGDCWYVASLAAVTQKNPQFIKDGIKQNPNGTVSVRIWDKEGNHHWVTVTPDLPTDTNGSPIGTYGNGTTWPAYYEKAFAAAYSDDDDGERGYGGIEGDDPKDSAPYLTGHEGEDITKSGGFLGLDTEEDKSLSSLKKAYDAGQPVTVSTPDDDKLEKNVPKQWGSCYSTNHAYYVRGFTNDGKVILGNPWGASQYPPITVDQEQFNKYFQMPEKYKAP